MKIYFALILLLTVVCNGQQTTDDLETLAFNVMSSVHSHLGSENSGSSNSLYSFVTNSDFTRDAALTLNRTRRERIEEGLGSHGVTFVSVTRGKQQVNVTTHYGVGAGAVINVREDDQQVDAPSSGELHAVVDPIYETVVEQIAADASDDAIHVHLGHEAHTGFGLRDKKERIEAKVAGGFRVASKTTISKKS